MNNVFWLIPELLAGRPGPTYAEWSLPQLHAHGFKAVLNLSEFAPDSREFEAAGLICEWMPIPNSYPATEEAEVACLQILPRADAFIAEYIAAAQAVLVHCAWGRDRTGIAMAYYLAAHQELPAGDAIAAVKRVQPKALSATGWEAMADRVISRLLTQP